MFETETFIEPIPTWAICALINGDYSGLSDADIRLINDWQELTNLSVIGTEEDSTEYFTKYPSFGLATNVIDCICVIR